MIMDFTTNKVIILVGLYLLVLALLEIKKIKIPSIFATTIILLVLIQVGITNKELIYFPILAFCFGWLLTEFDLFRNIIDIKTIVIIGATITTLNEFYLFMTTLVFLTVLYLLILQSVFKTQNDEVPSLPLLFIVYTLLHIFITFI